MICRYRYGIDVVEDKGIFKEKYRYSLGGLLIWILDHTDYYSTRAIGENQK